MGARILELALASPRLVAGPLARRSLAPLRTALVISAAWVLHRQFTWPQV